MNETKNTYFDMLDMHSILKRKGSISGYSNTIHVDNAENNIIENISIDDFKDAKSIYCIFDTNINTSMFLVSDIMENISNTVSENTDIILHTYTNNNLDVDYISYKIILTGIGIELDNTINDEELSEVESYNEVEKDELTEDKLKNALNQMLNSYTSLEQKNKELESELKSLKEKSIL